MRSFLKKPKNRRPVIFVDVDNTLILWKRKNGKLKGELNVNLLNRIKTTEADLVLWSRRGRNYAKNIADRFKLEGVFVAIIGKPTTIFDDEGEKWAMGIKINP